MSTIGLERCDHTIHRDFHKPGEGMVDKANSADWVLMRAETMPRVAESAGISRASFTRAEIGSQQLATGMTSLASGASLHLHIHPHDESITVLSGEPDCEIGGRGEPLESHRLQPLDTIFIPAHTAHRFVNRTDGSVSILWSYPTALVERITVNPDTW